MKLSESLKFCYDSKIVKDLVQLAELASLLTSCPVSVITCTDGKDHNLVLASFGLSSINNGCSFKADLTAPVTGDNFCRVSGSSLENFCNVIMYDKQPGITYYLSIPFEIKEKQIKGVITVFDSGLKTLPGQQRRGLVLLAMQVVNKINGWNEANETNSAAITEDSYQRLIQNAPVSIFILRERKFYYLNKVALCLFGAEKEDDLLGKDFMDFVDEAFQTKANERLSAVERGETLPIDEGMYKKLDGSTVNVEVTATPITWSENDFIQIIAHDVTKRVQDRVALYKSKEEFKALAENSKDLIFRLNRRFEFEYINKITETYTGIPAHAYIGKTHRQLGFPPPLCDIIEQNCRNVFETGEVAISYSEFSRPDGITSYHYSIDAPEYDKDGNIVSILTSVRDITELKQNEQKLLKINKELDRLVYSASHELKAPLRSIMGLARVALKEYESGNLRWVKECLIGIETSIFRLDKTILNIIDYSRNSRMEVKAETVNIGGLLADIFSELEYIEVVSLEKRIIIQDDLQIKADRSRLKIILSNIIANAMRFADPAKETKILKIEVKSVADKIVFEIEDNGIGIDDTSKGKIFDMFYRGTVRSEGAGLGLYIVKEILSNLNGTIEVESEVERGAIFRVSIPALS